MTKPRLALERYNYLWKQFFALMEESKRENKRAAIRMARIQGIVAEACALKERAEAEQVELESEALR